MLQAAIGAIILTGIFSFMNSRSECEVDRIAAFGFILAPGFLIFLLSMLLVHLGVAPWVTLFGYLLYFFIPFAYLKYGLEFEDKPAFNFAIVVPLVAIFTEIPLMLIF